MKKAIGAVIAAALVGLFAWTVWYLYGKSKEKPVEYATQTPARADIIKKTIATGSLIPRQEVAIKPRVSGVIEKLFVEPGQKVAAGDQIAKIKIIPNVVNLNSAEANVKTAQINLDNARRRVGYSATLEVLPL